MNTPITQPRTNRFQKIKKMLTELDYGVRKYYSKHQILSYMSDEEFNKLEDKYYEEMKWRSRGCEYW